MTNKSVASPCSVPVAAGSAADDHNHKTDTRVNLWKADTTNGGTGQPKNQSRDRETNGGQTVSAAANPEPAGAAGLHHRNRSEPRRRRDTTSHATGFSPRETPNQKTIFGSAAANDATTTSPGFGATIRRNRDNRPNFQKGENTTQTANTPIGRKSGQATSRTTAAPADAGRHLACGGGAASILTFHSAWAFLISLLL